MDEPRLLGRERAGELCPGDHRSQRPDLGDVEEREHRAVDEGDGHDQRELRAAGRDRGGEPAERQGPHDVGDDHDPPPVEAVGQQSRGEDEERVGKDARERHQARLRRGMGQREREQRVGDRRRLVAERRQELPGLQQHEVAVLPQRERRLAPGPCAGYCGADVGTACNAVPLRSAITAKRDRGGELAGRDDQEDGVRAERLRAAARPGRGRAGRRAARRSAPPSSPSRAAPRASAS